MTVTCVLQVNAQCSDPRRHDNHDFRHLLEKHELASWILETINNYLRDKGLSLRQGTIVGAIVIHAPSSTKNKEGKRDPPFTGSSGKA